MKRMFCFVSVQGENRCFRKECVMRYSKMTISKSILFLSAFLALTAFRTASSAQEVRYYPLTRGSQPHDVAPAPDGTVWYTAQARASLGRLDPATGKVEIGRAAWRGR